MGLLIRTLQRIAIFAIGAISIWLIVFVVFDFADQELPVYFALMATYLIGAYIILPYAVRMGLKVSQRRRVPSFTVAADGLPADPVNLVLVGTLDQLRRPSAPSAGLRPISWPRQLLADGEGVRAQQTLSDGAVLDAVLVRARAGHRLPKGDRRQSAQAPPRAFLGPQPEAHGGRRHGQLLAQHRSAAGGRQRALGGRRHQGHRLRSRQHDISDHARDGHRHQRGARLHRR